MKHRNVSEILDGRKSFPSGSSSAAFVGMTFSTLFLASKTAGLCFSISSPVSSLRSPLIRLCLVLSPFAFSTWVAIASIEDYVCPSIPIVPLHRTDHLRSVTTRQTWWSGVLLVFFRQPPATFFTGPTHSRWTASQRRRRVAPGWVCPA
jgi:hypothetical protein